MKLTNTMKKPVPDDVMRWLESFAETYGKRWRAELRGQWNRGEDANDPSSRTTRNILGPSGLNRIKIVK